MVQKARFLVSSVFVHFDGRLELEILENLIRVIVLREKHPVEDEKCSLDGYEGQAMSGKPIRKSMS